VITIVWNGVVTRLQQKGIIFCKVAWCCSHTCVMLCPALSSSLESMPLLGVPPVGGICFQMAIETGSSLGRSVS
jgi:hypothetical protein